MDTSGDEGRGGRNGVGVEGMADGLADGLGDGECVNERRRCQVRICDVERQRASSSLLVPCQVALPDSKGIPKAVCCADRKAGRGREDPSERMVVLEEEWHADSGVSLSVSRLDVDELGFIALEPIRPKDHILQAEDVPAWQLGAEGVKVRRCC
eukprot:680900-Hanusia_phi.AAC.1